MKYFGNVGYAVTEETSPGVWTEQIREQPCYGDVTRNYKKYESSEHLNDDLNVSNQFSLVLNKELIESFMFLRYIWWMGQRWEVGNVELAPPRLILQVGGVYNGPDAEEEGTPPDGTGETD